MPTMKDGNSAFYQNPCKASKWPPVAVDTVFRSCCLRLDQPQTREMMLAGLRVGRRLSDFRRQFQIGFKFIFSQYNCVFIQSAEIFLGPRAGADCPFWIRDGGCCDSATKTQCCNPALPNLAQSAAFSCSLDELTGASCHHQPGRPARAARRCLSHSRPLVRPGSRRHRRRIGSEFRQTRERP